ncbi:MAG: L,D-transpeptidase family protein [Clostridium sp.]
MVNIKKLIAFLICIFMIISNTTYLFAHSKENNKINQKTTQMKVNANSLNIRSGPATKYKKIGSFKNGTTIQTTSKSGIWYKVKYKKTYGWCSGDYLIPITDNNQTNQNNNLSKGHYIIIKTSNNKMAYYQDGKLIKECTVATGSKSSPTPKGQFKIVNKIINRPYYKQKIPGGDPRNPLGNRWLGLEVGKTYGTTYAIHGNNNENSIGKNISEGCIRMHNKDVKWLFDQIPKESKVIITGSEKSFKEIGNSYNLNLE